MQKGEGRRGLKMRRGVVAVSSVTKICLQPAISTVIHDKDEIRGVLLILLLFQELSQLTDSSTFS